MACFNLAVVDTTGLVRGVAIVGRPVARLLDDGKTMEVNRVATDGCFNACSMLYGAAWRVVKAQGYQRLVTYTLPEEGGTSLKASGWTNVGLAGGTPWGHHARPGHDKGPQGKKWRWEKYAEGWTGQVRWPWIAEVKQPTLWDEEVA